MKYREVKNLLVPHLQTLAAACQLVPLWRLPDEDNDEDDEDDEDDDDEDDEGDEDDEDGEDDAAACQLVPLSRLPATIQTHTAATLLHFFLLGRI